MFFKKKIFKAVFLIPMVAFQLHGCNDDSGGESLQESSRYKIIPTSEGGLDSLQRNVNLSSGGLFLSKKDQSSPYFQFERYYNSNSLNNKWNSLASSKIVSTKEISTPSYSSKEDACTLGWDTIKDTSYLGLLSNSQAQYQNQSCQVFSGGELALKIPVVSEESDSKVLFLPTGEHILIEAEGSEWTKDLNEGRTLHRKNNSFTFNNGEKTYTYSSNGLIKSINNDGVLINLNYDTDNKLIKAILPSNQEVSFHYDDTQLKNISSPYGEVEYFYNSSGVLTEVHHNGNLHEAYEYDSSCNDCLAKVKDSNGNTIDEYSYDAMNRILSNNDDHFSYNGNVTSVLSGGVLDVEYKFQMVGDKLKPVEIYGKDEILGEFTRTLEYNEIGKLSKIIEEDSVSSYDYNTNHQLIKSVIEYNDGARDITLTKWNGNNPNIVVNNNSIEVTSYDNSNRVTEKYKGFISEENKINLENQGLSGVSKDEAKLLIEKRLTSLKNTYDHMGNLIEVNDSLKGTNKYEYDEHGYISIRTNPLGAKEKTKRTAFGKILEKISFDGEISNYEYDEINQLRRISTSTNDISYQYDDFGRVNKIESTLLGTTEYSYNQDNLTESITNNDGTQTVLDYEGQELVSARKYSESGKMIEDVSAYYVTQRSTLGQERRQFNRRGDLTNLIDAEGKGIQYRYASNGLVNEIIYPKGESTKFEYNQNYLLKSISSPNGTTTEFDVDKITGLTTQERNPDYGNISYQYDKNNNIAKRIYGDNTVIDYTYDIVNRPTSITSDQQSVIFKYDEGENGYGKMTTLLDNSGETRWDYQDNGLITNQTINGSKYSTHYSYNDLKQLEKIRYPSGS